MKKRSVNRRKMWDNSDSDLILPYDRLQVDYWTRKWGISQKQLHDAILDTGSIKTSVIRSYLEKKGQVFTLRGFMKGVKIRIAALP